MKINYIIYYIDIQYNKYDYVVLLNYNSFQFFYCLAQHCWSVSQRWYLESHHLAGCVEVGVSQQLQQMFVSKLLSTDIVEIVKNIEQ